MSEWISVEDRLPEPGDWVLVIYKYCRIPLIATLRSGGAWRYDDGDPAYSITHWQPLPPPPPTPEDRRAAREALPGLMAGIDPGAVRGVDG